MFRNLVLVSIVLVLYGGDLPARDLRDDSVTRAANLYAVNEYQRAHAQINFVLRLDAGGPRDETVLALGESIYFAYLRQLLENEQYDTFEDVRTGLESYPAIRSDRIERLLERSEDDVALARRLRIERERLHQEQQQETQRLQAQTELRMMEFAEQRRVNEQQLEIRRLELDELERRNRMLEAEQQTRFDIAAEERRQQREFNQALLGTLAASRADSGLSADALVAIAVGGVAGLVGFVVLLLVLLRTNQHQQQLFEYAVHQARQPRDIISIPVLTAPPAERSRSVERYPDRRMLPAAEPDIATLKRLVERSREIAEEIEEHTGRRNTTRNVAELVFKVSAYLGYDEHECTLFLAVALVYDVGFLSFDASFFDLDSLTEEQRERLTQHTRRGVDRIRFVPEELLPLFRDGILKHHEGLDGGGYPDGLRPNEIPFIARAIRACESFVAMTSKRVHGRTRDKTEALEELKSQTGHYDASIVDAIESIV